VWSKTDLSDNTRDRALRNAAIEGVGDRVEIRDADARSLPFPDQSIDVVVSMLCLHNIEDGQERALAEIVRVLRPGGTAIVSDLGGTEQYAAAFSAAGMHVTVSGIAWDTFPFQRVVTARKA
jgi:ubiquinone/menaquinone biosynthesis C-methylase UbiE